MLSDRNTKIERLLGVKNIHKGALGEEEKRKTSE